MSLLLLVLLLLLPLMVVPLEVEDGEELWTRMGRMAQPLFLSHSHCSELTLHSSLDRTGHKVRLLSLVALSLSLLPKVEDGEDGEEFSARMKRESLLLLLLLPLLALTLPLPLPVEDGEEF